jgi:uncharacterized protein YodC (DUF2158 family)
MVFPSLENEMSDEFKAGDLVQLKSGGPKMVVEQVGEDFGRRKRVWCNWFDGNKKSSDTFAPEQLKIAE